MSRAICVADAAAAAAVDEDFLVAGTDADEVGFVERYADEEYDADGTGGVDIECCDDDGGE